MVCGCFLCNCGLCADDADPLAPCVFVCVCDAYFQFDPDIAHIHVCVCLSLTHTHLLHRTTHMHQSNLQSIENRAFSAKFLMASFTHNTITHRHTRHSTHSCRRRAWGALYILCVPVRRTSTTHTTALSAISCHHDHHQHNITHVYTLLRRLRRRWRTYLCCSFFMFRMDDNYRRSYLLEMLCV